MATIGDAYYAVCGHEPQHADAHAATMLAFAEAVLAAVERMRMPGGAPLRIRAGLHCGPAHAGVIGYKKPHYVRALPPLSLARACSARLWPRACASVASLRLTRHPAPMRA